MHQFLTRFLYITKGRHRSLLWLLVLFLVMASLEFIGIGMVGPFISVAINPASIQQNQWLSWVDSQFGFSSDNNFILALGLFVILIFYIKSFISFNAQKSVFEFGFRLQAELMSRLLHDYLVAPYTFHLSRNSSSIIKTITQETSVFCAELMMPLLTSISNGIVITALLILLIKTDVMAMVIILGIVVIALIMFYLLKENLGRWGREFSESNTEIIRLINHSLGGLKETRVIGCEPYFEGQMRASVKKYYSSSSKAIGFSNLPRYLIEAFLITFLVVFTLLFVVINRDHKENLTAVLGIFALASIRLLPATGNLFSGINGIKYRTYSLDNIYLELRELERLGGNSSNENLVDHSNSNTARFMFKDAVVLDNISYCYPNAARYSLKSVSLTLHKGDSIGLIGKSGAGKTTLVDVILGLLQPESGVIRVDGQSIYTDIRSWQNMIGYVPQSIFLMDDTLERNIAFGVPDWEINSDRLERAIQAAQLSELVEQLPNGTQTVIGERGVLLSGGQRQRIGIARALYHEREILVFDEATAALDNETEALVTESIKSLSGKKTMIIIAHRLSTIEHCDRIYALEQGEVVKSGSYQEVIEPVRPSH